MHAVQNSCKTLSHPAAGPPAQWAVGEAEGRPPLHCEARL